MIFLDDHDVLKLADPADLIAAMARAFATTSDLPARIHCDLPGDDKAKLLVMPAWLDREAIGVKVATVMPRAKEHGRPTISGIYVLLDGMTGEPRGIINASALTAVRTAAVSALASQHLSRRNASTLLMIGTGALAPHLIQAHAAVRSFDKVLVWGRDTAKAQSVARQQQGNSFSIEAITDLADGVAQADVISSATAANAPLIFGGQVKPGTHVDLVGSFTPHMREADSALFARARLVVDTPDAFDESGDLIFPFKEGAAWPEEASSLHEVIDTPSLRRRNETEITVFKSVGTGLADIAAAYRLCDLAEAANWVESAPASDQSASEKRDMKFL